MATWTDDRGMKCTAAPGVKPSNQRSEPAAGRRGLVRVGELKAGCVSVTETGSPPVGS